jgi:predicted transcriptional regulator of viral defense system
MIISRLSEYLQRHQRASVRDMALSLDTDVEALRSMLNMLERKGRIARLPSGTSCSGGCGKCQPETVEIYEWVSHDQQVASSHTHHANCCSA